MAGRADPVPAPGPDNLGEEISRHGLRPAPLVGMFVGTAVGACCLNMIHPLVAGLALIPLGVLIWQLVARGRDRLVVFQDGFAFRHRGRVRCWRWDDVDRVNLRLGPDRRGWTDAVKTRDGEVITFSSFMAGLDVLYRAYVTDGGRDLPPEPELSDAGIGALISTHGATHRRGYLPAGILGGVLALFALALLIFTVDVPHVNARDLAAALGCNVIAFGFLGLLLWLALSDRDDELRIHEHGFAYRHGGVVQECRWDEIVSYQTRRTELTAVMRQDRTWISLSSHVPAVKEYVLPRVRITPDHSPP